MRAVLGTLLLSALLTGCAGSSSPPPAAAEAPAACSKQLGPRSASRSGVQPTAAAAAAPSRLIVEARLPLARLGSELERSVAPRLAEGTAVKLGPAGVLNYSVDRGAFSLSIANGQLVVETPLDGRAEACSGRRCYASCEPRALARAEIPLWLRSDYRFDSSRVALEFTRGCKVRALGGLLNVDVTPILKSRVAPQLERVRREIDRRLPDVRADIERAWRQLSTPRALPLGGCIVVEPLRLVQGPVQESGGMAHARFALLARPELRTECGSAPSASLPPLSADPTLPDEDDVTLGMELPLASLARAFEAATPEAGPGPRFRVAAATIEAAGQRVVAELTLAGELCGSLALQAEPVFAGEQGVIELTAGKLDAGDAERAHAAGVDPAELALQLTQLPRPDTPLSLPMLRVAPTALAALFSDPKYSLNARVSRMRAAGAAAREENLVAWVEARGSLLLELK
ncbi:MAG TPA: DUF4403 family protein [Polyangiaceae bacterium]|nr:DUF4403 family protein [Polyangiaceae bacterium]